MDIDGTLVMDNFLSAMGNLFVVFGFTGIITLCVTSVFIYFVHVRRSDYEDYLQ